MAFRVITGHCYLSPAFTDLAQLEVYLGEYLVDLLHVHFWRSENRTGRCSGLKFHYGKL